MTPEQAAAFVIAQAVSALAELEAMKQANAEWAHVRDANLPSGAPYNETDFRTLDRRYCIGHNAVLQCFQDANR